MGTRHLITVISDGSTRVAQYGQFDGYPAGVGVDIQKFLHGSISSVMCERLRDVYFVTSEQAAQEIKDAGYEDMIPSDKWDQYRADFPTYARETSAGILQLIYDGIGKKLIDHSDFASDTVFCEFVYTINYDSEIVTVTSGSAASFSATFEDWISEDMTRLQSYFWPDN